MATFDVVKDYSWTTVPKGAPLREEAPVANVTSFEYLEDDELKLYSGSQSITKKIEIYDK